MGAHLSLLGGFRLLIDGSPVSLPLSAQRTIAFVAIQNQPVPRSHVAASLWLDTSEERACANLRSCLWRLRRLGHPVIAAAGGFLGLAPKVVVDVRMQQDVAHELMSYSFDPCYEHIKPFLCGDLLPDWSEEWVVSERERLRQLRLHILEELCVSMAQRGRFSLAVQAGIAAVSADPLRESAHRALMQAYLDEGNYADALRQYHLYRWSLETELGLSPSALMEEIRRSLKQAVRG